MSDGGVRNTAPATSLALGIGCAGRPVGQFIEEVGKGEDIEAERKGGDSIVGGEGKFGHARVRYGHQGGVVFNEANLGGPLAHVRGSNVDDGAGVDVKSESGRREMARGGQGGLGALISQVCEHVPEAEAIFDEAGNAQDAADMGSDEFRGRVAVGRHRRRHLEVRGHDMEPTSLANDTLAAHLKEATS